MRSKSIDDDTAIEFVRVTKTYRLYQSERRRFWGYVSRHRNFRPMRANKNVSFKIKKGEAVAVLGNNGAGKSTLLKLITGVTFPSNGVVKVNGRVSALLELSAGFDDFFTGRQNIYLKGMLLGLKKKEIKKIILRVYVKTLEASSLFFSPSNTEMRTDAPVAIKFEKPNTIIIIGIIKLTAARASPPIKRPTNNPSAI